MFGNALIGQCVLAAFLVIAIVTDDVAQAEGLGVENITSSSVRAVAVYVGDELRSSYRLEVDQDSWVARDAEPLSEAVLREAYFARSSSMACTDATSAFRALRELKISSDERDADRRYFSLRRYVESCLTPYEKVSDRSGTYSGINPDNAATLFYMLGDEGLKKLRSSLVFTPESSGQFCSGTLAWIERDGRRALNVVTAAHCLGRVEDDVSSDTSVLHVNLLRNISFLDARGRKLRISISNGHDSRVFDGIYSDIAAIELPDTFDGFEAGVDLSSREPSAWQGLYVIGQNRYLADYRIERYNRSGGELPLPPQDSTVVSLETGCRAFGRKGALLMHNCQTIEGTSGAGVFLYEDGQLKLMGVHGGDKRALLRYGIEVERFVEASSSENFLTVLGVVSRQ
jgi:hypothetical protein